MQLATLKESARQISELDYEDYAILAKATGPHQPCSASLDIFEPVAIQLAQYVKKCRLDDQGSDSGTVSDYESTGCDIAESIQCSKDFDDLRILNKRSSEQSHQNQQNLFGNEDIHSRNTTPNPLHRETDTSSSLSRTDTSSADISDITEDALCSLDTSEESNDPCLQGSLWHLMMDIDSASDFTSVGHLPDRDIESKLIMVTELEKTFFSANSDQCDFAELACTDRHSVRYTTNATISSQPGTTGAFDIQRHWKSQLHLRGEEGWGATLRYPALHNSQGQLSLMQLGNRKYSLDCEMEDLSEVSKSGRRANSLHPHHEYSGSLTKESKIKCTENSTAHLETSSKNRSDRAKGCSKKQQQQQQREQQAPSPLALHSRNMWSAAREETAKSSRRQNRHRQHQNRHKNRGKDFNHHEVGSFLMEGRWKTYIINMKTRKGGIYKKVV